MKRDRANSIPSIDRSGNAISKRGLTLLLPADTHTSISANGWSLSRTPDSGLQFFWACSRVNGYFISQKYHVNLSHFGLFCENDTVHIRDQKCLIQNKLKKVSFVGIGSYCFCCWEFAALSRPSNWSSCEQRSLLYGWHILCLLPPILGRPLFKSWLHVTNTSSPKSTFNDNTIIQKMQTIEPAFEARPWLVGDSNRQETSCEWGLTL